jgi:HK97 family phage major capsid protein
MPNMEKHIKPGSRVERSLSVERAMVDAEARTVELAFASETPYDRWWGTEILDCAQTSIRLGRLVAGGPLLMDHDSRDHVGVIESVQIGADRVCRAVVRFGKSARAEEVFQDVLDGIRRNVSVGYMIHEAKLVETSEDKDIYRVTDWEPFEVSIVSVPADASVGVGRSADEESPVEVIEQPDPVEDNETEAESTEEIKSTEGVITMSDINIDQIRADAVKEEQKRASEIQAMGEHFARFGADKIAAECLRNGDTVEATRAKIMEKIGAQAMPTAEIGLSEKEARSFSFMRAINALANPGDRKAQAEAAFERECSDAFAGKNGRSAQGFFVPVEVQRRDLEVSTANSSTGGKLVATDLVSFIDALRNKMVVTSLGAQMLSGLVGSIAIPRQTAGATAYWVAESGAPTESQQTIDQVTMNPKTVGAFTDISRKLMLQSSIDVEAFVRNDLATVLALAIDLAAINGSGSNNQPTGILATSGIGSVAGGTNGAAPTLANMIDLETAVSVANADVGSLAYLTNAKVRGKLKQTFKNATYGDVPVWGDGNMVNGYNAAVSNQVPSNLTKGTASGVCSAVLFGNFADLIIGQWGALDLMVDPYTNSTSGTVRVVALQDVDVAVRHAESFAAMKDALTA